MKQVVEYEWTLVKDEMPKDSSTVLTIDDKGRVRYCDCYKKKFYGNFRDYRNNDPIEKSGINIIAWRYKTNFEISEEFFNQLLEASK